MSTGPLDFSSVFGDGLDDDRPPDKNYILEILGQFSAETTRPATPKEIAQIMIIVFCDLMLTPGVLEIPEDEDKPWQVAFIDGYTSISRWVIKSLLVAIKRQSDFNIRVLNYQEFDRMLPKIEPQRVYQLLDIEQGDTPDLICRRIMPSLTYYFRRIDRFAHDGAVMFADLTQATIEGDAIPLALLSQMDTEFTDVRSYRPRRYGSVDIKVIRGTGSLRIFGDGRLSIPEQPAHKAEQKAALKPAVQAPTSSLSPAAIGAVQIPAPDEALLARVKALEEQLGEARKEIQEARSEGAQADQDRMLKLLKGRIRVLQNALSRTRADPAREVAFPTSFDDLGKFSAEHLGDRVIISRRAQRAATSSSFRNVALAYRVLKMLADDYLPMREGEDGAKERFDAACQRLKVTISPTGMALQSHRTSETYRVNHLGRRYPLDLHVQGNSSFDPRDGFRLYFHVIEDEEEGRSIIVGHFPEHLPNALT